MKKLLTMILVALTTITLTAGCSDNGPVLPVKTFVLVHGGWQAPFVWEAVKLAVSETG